MSDKETFRHFGMMQGSLSTAEVQDFSRKKVMDQMNIDDQLLDLFEKAKKKFQKIHPELIDMAPLLRQAKTSHYGWVNKNLRMYKDKNAKPGTLGTKSAKTWALPFEKPVIKNHDSYSDPLGRVFDASYVSFDTDQNDINIPSGVIVTHSYHTDPNVIRKIQSNEFLTDSMGGTASDIICSICGCNYLKADYDDWCDHRQGQLYDGELCYNIQGDFDYKEYSFVNTPADTGKLHFAGMTNLDIISANDSFQMKDIPNLIKDHLGSEFSPYIRDEKTGILITMDENSLTNSNIAKFIKPKIHLFGSPATDTSSNDDTLDTDGSEQDQKNKPKVEDMPQTVNGAQPPVSVEDLLQGSDIFNTRVNDAVTLKSDVFDKEKEQLEATIAEQKKQIDSLTKVNGELETTVKKVSIDRIMELGMAIKKSRFKPIFDSKKSAEELSAAKDLMIAEYQKRTIDSLGDALIDIQLEAEEARSVDGRLDAANSQIAGTDSDGTNGSVVNDSEKPGEDSDSSDSVPML